MTTSIPTVPLPRPIEDIPADLRTEKVIRFVTGMLAFFSLGFTISLAGLAIYRQEGNLLYVAPLALISFIVNVLMRNRSLSQDADTRLIISGNIFLMATTVFSVLFTNVTLQSAGILILVALIIVSSGVKPKNIELVISAGLISMAISAILALLNPFVRANDIVITYGSYGCLLALAIVYAGMMLSGMLTSGLRVKFILTVVMMVTLPLVILNIIDTRFVRASMQNQTEQFLANAAATLSRDIDTFFIAQRSSISTQAQLKPYVDFLSTDPQFRMRNSVADKQVRASMQSYISGLNVKDRSYMASFALLDMNGKVVFSSKDSELNRSESDRIHFGRPAVRRTTYYSPVEFASYQDTPTLTFSDLIRNSDGRPLGVVRVQFEAGVIQRMATDAMRSTSNTAFPIVFDEKLVRLADPKNPKQLFHALGALTPGTLMDMVNELRLPQDSTLQSSSGETAFAEQLAAVDQSAIFTLNLGDDSVQDSIAVTRVENHPWYVVFTQDQSTLIQLVEQQNTRSNAITTLIASIVSLIAMLVARVITNPIIELTGTAQRISSGDLEASNRVQSKDELGILGRTLNLMAGQLRQLVTGLEDRVNERTKELALQNENLRFRSRQMETVADVARSITTAQELENLLDKITRLVSERFGFYHVGIFLLDEAGDYAVLRAANSEGGQRMLARRHRLQVGQTGIVGNVTSSGQPRIATDVGQDATFFNNPDLPNTRSEMALPLKVGEEIFGALDVQSTQSNAFSQDDIQLFRILADQIAVAIYNNRLFAETASALQEARNLHRRYLEQEWDREMDAVEHPGYVFNNQGTQVVAALDTSDIRAALEQGDVVTWQDDSGTAAAGLTVPVKLRGEPIGLIRVQEAGAREWQAEDFESVQAVADQVALALENARLFSQTRRKAERERRVLEITNKIRATNDPTAMLQIAVEELQRSLNASRAQVIIQPHTARQSESGVAGNGNGNGHGPHGQPTEN